VRPTREETLSTRFNRERRMVERTWLFREALLTIRGLPGTYRCGVRDISNIGTGLRLNGVMLLPVDFSLSFDGFRTTSACRLIWREGDFAGASFR
jgi:hypothetical protein